MANIVPCFFTLVFLGSYSDRGGRKRAILPGIMGGIIRMCTSRSICTPKWKLLFVEVSDSGWRVVESLCNDKPVSFQLSLDCNFLYLKQKLAILTPTLEVKSLFNIRITYFLPRLSTNFKGHNRSVFNTSLHSLFWQLFWPLSSIFHYGSWLLLSSMRELLVVSCWCLLELCHTLLMLPPNNVLGEYCW